MLSIRKESLSHHIRKVHSPEDSRIVCDECDKTYSNMDNLKRHKSNEHLGLGESKIRVTCDKCYMSFSSASALNRHKSNQHLGLRNYQCNDCPAKFATKDNMARHQLRNKHYFMYFCEKCKLTMLLRSRSARDRHVKQCSPTSTKIEHK